MDLTRLKLLVELSRWETMAAVAEETGYGTSAVSKHLAILEREAGVQLLAADGRRVRLTPAGNRLVEHAKAILDRLEEARAELEGDTDPSGTVRVASFGTAAEPLLVPALHRLAADHPLIDVHLYEHEPDTAVERVLADRMDLGIIYDYSLVPRELPSELTVHELGGEPLFLAVPADGGRTASPAPLRLKDVRALSEASWFANSRGEEDAELARRLCAAAGYTPRIAHRVDSVHIVTSLVAAGLGVALVPRLGIQPNRDDIVYRPAADVAGARRIFLISRHGGWAWAPIRTVGRYLLDTARRTPLDPTE
jgi:DNA-binding transcriptional LysR family regulator